MEQIITCINCPVGCRMTVTLNDNNEFVSVKGNTCMRGAKYAEQECTLPKRMVTAVLPVKDCPVPLSVKTSVPIPKELIHSVMSSLGKLELTLPIRQGQVIIHNILGTDVDIVSTRNLP